MFDLPKYGDGVCLARLAELLEALAVNRERLQRLSIVITGSNGKGSTAAFCAHIGRAFGLRTGLFTSPHLYRINERFQIDGVQIDDDDLTRLERRIEIAIAEVSRRRAERFGNFEAMFALACLYFQEKQCDFTVFEAGIGGRYDPVRLVGALFAGVASVDFEHVKLLGNRLELIVFDKSDACASGGTIVYGENCRVLRPHILEYNRYRAITSLFVRDQIGIRGETISSSGQHFDLAVSSYDFRALETRLSGTFQFNNAAIAVALFLLWLGKTQPEAARAAIEASIRTGLGNASWPGRLEVIAHDPLTVIDVGHTPDGVQQALTSLKAAHGAGGWLLVLGVSYDKKADEIAAVLAPSFDTIIGTSAHHKGAEAETVAAAARRANPNAAIHVAASIEDAFRLSQALAATQQRKIYAAGGLFLAIEYATLARGGRTKDLHFL